MINSPFFAKEGEKGITLTSAQHICAIATQQKKELLGILNSVNFVGETVSLIGQSNASVIHIGWSNNELDKMESLLSDVATYDAIISWFSEARKAVESYRNSITCSVVQYCKERGIEYPEFPEQPEEQEVASIEDIIDSLNIKEKEEYLSLLAKSAVYGKFIHPDGSFNSAREDMIYRQNNPLATDGIGRDMTIRSYKPSVKPESVHAKFAEIQAKYRSVEQSLNHIKSELRKKQEQVNAENFKVYTERTLKYRQECQEITNRQRELNAKFTHWREEEIVKVSKIKIAIPDKLASAIDALNNLGK